MLSILILLGGLLHPIFDLPSRSLLLGLVDQELGLRERGDAAAMGGAKVGEEDGVDLIRAHAGALEEARAYDLRRQPGIDEDVALADADQAGRRVRRADGGGFVPEPVAAERAYADDVDPNRGHRGASVR